VTFKVPCITTLAAAAATIQGLESLRASSLDVAPLQDFHGEMAASANANKAKADQQS
jgi:hypothetical protein